MIEDGSFGFIVDREGQKGQYFSRVALWSRERWVFDLFFQKNNQILPMKKYQLWLQRKSYSQHLFNLMKIKYSHHSSLEKMQQSTVNRTPSRQNSLLSKYKQLDDFHGEAQKLGDVSYAITYKQLKNRKLRIMKTFEILNENMSMARRLKEVKSVCRSTFKDKTNSEHKDTRKMFEKKCQLSNEELREQNFKRFKKWQNNKTNHLHRYQLALVVESISKNLHSSCQYAGVWCEISTQKGFVRSDLVELEEFQGHKFFFHLDSELPKDCLFRLYVCKGLDSTFVGQIQFRRPGQNETHTTTQRSDDCQFEATLRLNYDKIKRQRPIFNLK